MAGMLWLNKEDGDQYDDHDGDRDGDQDGHQDEDVGHQVLAVRRGQRPYTSGAVSSLQPHKETVSEVGCLTFRSGTDPATGLTKCLSACA